MPSAATVGVPVGGGSVGVPPTWLNSHCIRATSEQVSCTTGLLPAVDPSLLLMHRPVATPVTRNLPLAAADAVNVHCWLVFVPSPQPHCWSCVPETVDDDGTSAHRVLPTF